MSWIEVKMRELGVLSHGSFKVTCFMDRSAMIPVESPPYGRFVTKPLGVLWGQFPEHANPGNTIMFDDLRTFCR
jgi:ubiquitin-like domain-containing CTD phosphatase 1